MLASTPTIVPSTATPRWMYTFNALAFAAPLIALALLSFADTHRVAFDVVVRERGPVELGTFGAWLVAGGLLALLARRSSRAGVPRWVPLFYAGFAVLCVLCGMEEISWGQAWFHYSTPLGLRDVNEQGEFNLHNLPGLMEMNEVVLLAFALAGLAGVRLARVPAFVPVATPRALVPALVWIAALGAIATACDLVLLLPTFNIIVLEMSEVTELLVALTCGAYAVLKLAEPRPAAPRAA